MLYTIIIQEQQEPNIWFDYYFIDNDRKLAEEFLKVFRNKNKDKKYRIVRLIQ